MRSSVCIRIEIDGDESINCRLFWFLILIYLFTVPLISQSFADLSISLIHNCCILYESKKKILKLIAPAHIRTTLR